jgi:S-adenosylmethionine hydrolase
MQRQWGPGPWEAMTARIERHVIRGLSSFYGEAPPGAVGMIIDSWGLLEIFVNQGHAGHVLGVGGGTRVQVWRAVCPDSLA